MTTDLPDDLDQLLKLLKLKRMREVIGRELERAENSQSSYEELVARLLREEYLYRRDQSLRYRIAQCKLPEQWSLESFPYKLQTGVKRHLIRKLAQLDFVPEAANVVFIGETGVGKTGLATGLMIKALENGYRGFFVNAQDLFDEMYASLADQSTRRLVNRLMNIDILCIDELGYLNIRPEQSNIFFKLMHERYNRKATIITTNLDYDDWYGFLGNKKMVSALLGRLRHRCTTIRIDGPSLRKPSES